jgi:lipopolysaccharide export LptBFGC system permease protein LptF
VIAGPGGETAPSGLRASHADREQVVDTLKAAFVQGRLAKEEFDARVGQAFSSRTYADLAAIIADVPDGPGAGPPQRQPARTLTRPEKAVAWGLYSIVMTVIFTVVVVPGPTTVGVVFVTAVVIYAIFWLLGGILMVATRRGASVSRAPGVSQAHGGASPPPRA